MIYKYTVERQVEGWDYYRNDYVSQGTQMVYSGKFSSYESSSYMLAVF